MTKNGPRAIQRKNNDEIIGLLSLLIFCHANLSSTPYSSTPFFSSFEKSKFPEMLVLNTISFIHRFSLVLLGLWRCPFTMKFFLDSVLHPFVVLLAPRCSSHVWEFFKSFSESYLLSIFLVIHLQILWATLEMCDEGMSNHSGTASSCTFTLVFIM